MARPGHAPAPAQRRPGRHARPGRAARGWLQGAGVLAVAVLVTAVTIVLVREVVLERGQPPAPPAPTLATAPAATAAPTTTAPPARGGWSGVWTVGQGPSSFVGYRVSQHLVGVKAPSEGVGRSAKVRGRVVLGQATIDAAEVSADLRALSGGDRRRDAWVAGHTLEVGDYPEARFVLHGPVQLGERPAQGAVVAVRAPGILSVHGAAKPVTFQLEGRWVGDLLEIVGRADIRLADWGVHPPSVAGLVRVDEQARIELRLRLGRG
jgi:polyisoprenoid-binding protein YceI